MHYIGLVLGLALLAASMAAIAGCREDTVDVVPPLESDASSLSAAEALTNGLQAHRDGRLEEAATYYFQVLAQDYGNQYALFNLGVIEQTNYNRPVAAESFYRLALVSDPDFESALFNLAVLRRDQGDSQEAMDLFRHLITVNPDHARAYLNLGLVLRVTGQPQEGDAAIERALELDPNLQVPIPAEAVPDATP